MIRESRSSACSAAYVSRSTSHGFTYIGLLILIALIGVALAGTGLVFHAQAQREKEKQLLFVGDQLRRAIGQYYQRSPGADKRFPQSLEDLLLDRRYPATQRYLRRIYRDPITGSSDWGLVRTPDDRIVGVYSRSEKSPMKSAQFPERYAEFAGKKSYSEWKFVYALPITTAGARSGQGPPATQQESGPTPAQ